MRGARRLYCLLPNTANGQRQAGQRKRISCDLPDEPITERHHHGKRQHTGNTMASNAPLSTAQILVVDDEPDLRMLYELTLLREGYRVETAESVAQALQHLDERRFDVVITDMRLPDGLGMELLRHIKTQQRGERCVVITAYGSAEN